MSLQKALASIEISSAPEGASIILARRSVGTTPTTLTLPEFEASTLTFEKDGYIPVVQKFIPSSDGKWLHAVLTKAAPSVGPGSRR
jgi:hypothetical protein